MPGTLAQSLKEISIPRQRNVNFRFVGSCILALEPTQSLSIGDP
jgi:hypothetical protein